VNVSPERPRFLVLTPAADGADGLSELSRQVVRALASREDADDTATVEVWALDGAAPVSNHFAPAAIFRSARGQRTTMVTWAFTRTFTSLHGLTVVVMHAHLAPLAVVLALSGARTAVVLVGVEVWHKLRARERYAIERADCLVAISNHTARRFRAANPDVRVKSISVCHPGIRPAPQPRHSAFEQGFALIVGRLWREERYKGHDSLIDVWPAVRERVPHAKLIVVGDGDDRTRLEARVAASGLGAAIQFTGRIGDDALADLYRGCDFFVMPSTGEGFGLAYLEAMRAGRPCIALHGAADEIIDNGASGLLVEAGQTARLIDAIVRLFTDADLRGRLGSAAAARVAREFTEQHFAVRFRAALGLAASAAPDPAPPIRAGVGQCALNRHSGG